VNVTPRVSEHRWPRLISFLPTATPFHPRSTTNPVMPLYPACGSVYATTKYQSATPALVIHILLPLST
jgi:hypothetical protein